MTGAEGWRHWFQSNGFLEADAKILQTTTGNLQLQSPSAHVKEREGRQHTHRVSSETNCFSPQGCQETVLQDMPLWWQKGGKALILSLAISMLLWDILQSDALQWGFWERGSAIHFWSTHSLQSDLWHYTLPMIHIIVQQRVLALYFGFFIKWFVCFLSLFISIQWRPTKKECM